MCIAIYVSYSKIKPHMIKLDLGDCVDCNFKL